MTLACLMSAIRISSESRSSVLDGNTSDKTVRKTLSDQRIVIFGAGSAGLGITIQLRDAMVAEDDTDKEKATGAFWLVDREGLLYSNEHSEESLRKDHRHAFYRPVGEGWGSDAHVQEGGKKSVSLLEVVKRVRPTVLIGCSTAAGAFTKDVIEAMVNGLHEGEHPIILPLSNPSRLVEATPEDLLEWTNGRALIATGSPFPCVKRKVDGKDMEFMLVIFLLRILICFNTKPFCTGLLNATMHSSIQVLASALF